MALVPDQLVTGTHRPPAQPVRRRTGSEREVDCDGHVDAVVDVEVHGSKRLDDVDAHRPDHERVRIVSGSSGMAGHRRSAVDHPELEGIQLAPRREVGHREDDDVAEAVAGVEDEEQALPPVLVVGDDVGQRLGDLVDEVLVERGQLGHVTPGEARGSRGQAPAGRGGQPS